MPGEFGTRLHMQQAFPVCEARYSIRLPEDRRLHIRFAGTPQPAVTETVKQGYRVYRWSVRDVPALKADEPQMPPTADLIASARIASLDDWAPVAAWYAEITRDKDAVTDALRQVALARTAGCTTADEKISALFYAVCDLPYIALEMGNLSDIPHPADATMRRNYGDCKDKATLLKALLRAVGIDSHYVLVRTADRGALDRQLCSPSEFNHVILAVRLPDGERYLDATIAGTRCFQLPPGVEGAEGLLIRDDGALVTLPVSTAEENRTEIQVTIHLAEDGSARGEAVLTFHGQTAAVQRGMLMPVPQEQLVEALQGSLAPRLGGEIVLTDVVVEQLRAPWQPLVLRATFASEHYVQPIGDLLAGYLPSLMYQSNRHRGARERRFPFTQNLASSLRGECLIHLPAGVDAAHLPKPVQYASEVGRYQDSIEAADGVLRFRCDLAMHRGQFPASLLDEMRAWSGILATEGRNQMQFLLRRR
jgi:hypothetical protein